jgi:hypothetical protein
MNFRTWKDNGRQGHPDGHFLRQQASQLVGVADHDRAAKSPA